MYSMVTIDNNGVIASLGAQMVKNLLAVQEIWVPSLGQEDPLEKGLATHSSVLAWRIPWTDVPGGLQFMGSLRLLYHKLQRCLLSFSCSVMFDSLRPHGLQQPGFLVLHHLPELAQTHVHWVSDAIQPSRPLLSPSPPALNLSQHQGLF